MKISSEDETTSCWHARTVASLVIGKSGMSGSGDKEFDDDIATIQLFFYEPSSFDVPKGFDE